MAPVTILDSNDSDATAIEPQRKIFYDPNSGYYYTLLNIGNFCQIHKSEDLSTWENAGSSPTSYGAVSGVYYNSGSQGFIYLALTNAGGHLNYRRVSINTSTGDITLGSEQQITLADEGIFNPAITQAADGYVFISYAYSYKDMGKLRWDIRAKATTTTNPGDSPSFSDERIIFFGTDIINGTALQHKTALVPFSSGSSYDVEIIYSSWSGSVNPLNAFRLTYSGSGSPIRTDLTLIASDFSGVFSVVVDSNDRIYTLYDDGSNLLIKSSDEGGVWGDVQTVLNATVDTLSLSIDLTSGTEQLYAFYVKASDQDDIYYKISDADSSMSFGSEQDLGATLTEDILYLSTSVNDIAGDSVIHVIWTTQTEYYIRYENIGVGGPSEETKQVTGDLYLKEVDKPKTVTGDLYLLEADTPKTVTGDLIIVSQVPKTVTGDLYIKGVDDTKEVTGDLYIKATDTPKTVTGDLYILEADKPKTVTGDLILINQFPKTVTGDLILLAIQQKDVTGDLYIKATDTLKQVTGDLILVSQVPKTVTGDLILLAIQQKDVTGDLLIKGFDQEKTVTGDLILGGAIAKEVTGDLYLKETDKPKTVTGDLILLLESPKTVTGDLYLQATDTPKQVTGDLILLAIQQKEVTGDLYIKGLDQPKTVTGDLYIKGVDDSQTVTGDLILLAIQQKDVTGDLLLKGFDQEKTVTGDLILGVFGQEEYSKTVTGDLYIKATDTPKTITGDLLIKGSVPKTVTGDLILLALTQKTVTGDLLLKGINSQTITGDLYLKKLGQIQTITGDLIIWSGSLGYSREAKTYTQSDKSFTRKAKIYTQR